MHQAFNSPGRHPAVSAIWTSPARFEQEQEPKHLREQTQLESATSWQSLLEELKQETARDLRCLRLESEERLEGVIDEFREKERAMRAAVNELSSLGGVDGFADLQHQLHAEKEKNAVLELQIERYSAHLESWKAEKSELSTLLSRLEDDLGKVTKEKVSAQAEHQRELERVKASCEERVAEVRRNFAADAVERRMREEIYKRLKPVVRAEILEEERQRARGLKRGTRERESATEMQQHITSFDIFEDNDALANKGQHEGEECHGEERAPPPPIRVLADRTNVANKASAMRQGSKRLKKKKHVRFSIPVRDDEKQIIAERLTMEQIAFVDETERLWHTEELAKAEFFSDSMKAVILDIVAAGAGHDEEQATERALDSLFALWETLAVSYQSRCSAIYALHGRDAEDVAESIDAAERKARLLLPIVAREMVFVRRREEIWAKVMTQETRNPGLESELSKVTARLRPLLLSWEEKRGRPFPFRGIGYLQLVQLQEERLCRRR